MFRSYVYLLCARKHETACVLTAHAQNTNMIFLSMAYITSYIQILCSSHMCHEHFLRQEIHTLRRHIPDTFCLLKISVNNDKCSKIKKKTLCHPILHSYVLMFTILQAIRKPKVY